MSINMWIGQYDVYVDQQNVFQSKYVNVVRYYCLPTQLMYIKQVREMMQKLNNAAIALC